MIIFIEGIDGAGKSSLIKNIEEYYISNNVPIFKRRFPTGELRKLLKKAKGEVATFLFLADHKIGDHEIREFIAGSDNGIVIADRSWISSLAYQQELLESGNVYSFLEDYVLNTFVRPNIIFWLSVSPRIGIERCIERAGDGEVKEENVIFLDNIQENYRRILFDSDVSKKIFSDIKIVNIDTSYITQNESKKIAIDVLKKIP